MSEHITAGVHDMPARQYFASNAVSNSELVYLQEPYTPAHFRAYKAGQIEREETEAMRIGTLTHRCILEPETMQAGSYAVKPDGMSYATKAGKEWREAQGDKLIVSQKHADMIARMIEKVWAHPDARALIKGSDHERSVFAQDDNLWLKSRVDCLTRNGNIIADIKTIELADASSIEKAIATHNYHRQAAFYLHVARLLDLGKDRFVFIFVEKTPPHCVVLHTLDPDTKKAGEMEINAAIATLKHCTSENSWPERPKEITPIGLPAWRLMQMEALL